MDKNKDDVGQINLDALRHQVVNGNFALRPHALQHAVKEGFTQDAMLQVVLQGRMVEDYPERSRCLLM